jgi:DNA-directed RNA polymerase subunit RPC12/RpoP
MTDDDLPPPQGPDADLDVRCPDCGRRMVYTGLPDVSGPVRFRFYRCPEHGVVRVDARDDTADGWG